MNDPRVPSTVRHRLDRRQLLHLAGGAAFTAIAGCLGGEDDDPARDPDDRIGPDDRNDGHRDDGHRDDGHRDDGHRDDGHRNDGGSGDEDDGTGGDGSDDEDDDTGDGSSGASFVVDRIRPIATTVEQGELLEVSAVVTNEGDEAASTEIELRVGDETVDTRGIRLGPGDRQQVEFVARTHDIETGEYWMRVTSEDDEVEGVVTVVSSDE